MPGLGGLAGRRRPVLAATAVLAVAGTVTPTTAQDAPAPSVPVAMLGTLDRDAFLMGAATQGEPGEAWAYRVLPADVPVPRRDAVREFAPEPANGRGQLVFLRATSATGRFVLAETPAAAAGQPFRSMTPNPLSARITPQGGGVLVGSNPNAPAGQRVVVLGRDRGDRFRVLPQPGTAVLQPAGGGDPAEVLALGDGTGRVAAAALDGMSRTELFLGVLGRTSETAVARWDGATWSREEVVPPPSSAASLRILAIDATSAENAWLLALEDAAAGTGVALYRRITTGPTTTWQRYTQDLGPWGDGTDPAGGVTALEPLQERAQAMTVGADVVWVDVRFTSSAAGGQHDATLAIRPSSGTVVSFCDVESAAGGPLCDHPLGMRFADRVGYRSFAFGGAGLGGRIVTGPLEAGSAEAAVNDGSYQRWDGTTVRRMPGGAPALGGGGAFSAVDRGWLPGPVRISPDGPPAHLRSWPVAGRSPLTGIVHAPGAPAGGIDQPALAVGTSGLVLRFAPGQGWQREFLLTSTGAVSAPSLRAVAWPEPGRAYAVGDLGAMWLWRSETGLWERDPATPLDGFQANLLGVAFDPSDPARGFAVGKEGTLLRYDKSWIQEALPSGFDGEDELTSIAFAGRQALVAAGSDVLVNDGQDSAWRVDEGLRDLLEALPSPPSIRVVAGLPDGGAVAAGRNAVFLRDSATAPWRASDEPLPGQTVVGAAALREADRVRALVTVLPQLPYPPSRPSFDPDPNAPPPLVPPDPLPGSGYLLRETGGGWVDEQGSAFASPSADKPRKTDPIAAFDVAPDGTGWVVGGWSGQVDESGRGTAAAGGSGREVRERVQTAAVFRYTPLGGDSPQPLGASATPASFPEDRPSFLLGAHANCAQPCANLRSTDLAPDRNLTRALADAAGLLQRPNGPRLMLYAGGRLDSAVTGGGLPAAEAARLGELLRSQPGVPVFPAMSRDFSSPGGVGEVSDALSGLPAPFGSAPAPTGIVTDGIPGAAPGPGIRTHYALDSTGPNGTVRIVVIDNSRGSLEASDPYQNPAEPQESWLASVLADAKAKGVPALVMGSRDLNSGLSPQINVASDADRIAQLLVDGGASAYLHERPEETRVSQIPSGGATTIPQFGTGALGYRSPIRRASLPEQPDALFGQTGYLLVSVQAAARDPQTNRAPVTATLQPLLDDLSLQAVDGTLLRRSRPALFQGLGRRPVAGDRWGPVSAGDGIPNPTGADPYTSFPPEPCLQANCASRVTPGYTFSSSAPDIADFVRQDPNSTNLRKPYQDAGKTVTDSSSGLLCAFNPGTTTITVSAGGLSTATAVRVLNGSVQQPCGTRPLDPSRFEPAAPPAAPPAPPPAAPAPAGAAPPPVAPPPPPPPAIPAPPTATPRPSQPPTPVPVVPPVDGLLVAGGSVVEAGTVAPPPPPAGAFARPIPPGGAVIRVFEEKREEEAAPESSQAFSAYRADEGPDIPFAPYVLGVVLLAAAAGASVRPGPRRRDHRLELAVAAAHADPPYRRYR